MRRVLIDKVAWIRVRAENNEGSDESRATQEREAIAIVQLMIDAGHWREEQYERAQERARRRRGNRGHIRVEVITQSRRTTS